MSDHIQLYVNSALVYEQQASSPPGPTGPTGPTAPPGPTGPVPPGVSNLGDMSVTGSPMENSCPNMDPSLTYTRRQSLVGKSGYFQFLSGNLTGYVLEDYASWVSGTAGGDPLPYSGCERQELFGSNVAAHSINVFQLQSAGISEIWYCLHAKGWTGRYMQRTP